MTEEMHPLATALGTYYPRHYVVAVIHDPGAAMKALEDLRAAGFTDAAAAICPGAEFVQNWSDFVAQRGPLERLADLFPAEEQSALEEYLAEAKRGASFVTVRATTAAERERARDLLLRHGGHAMRYYGDRTIIDLA